MQGARRASHTGGVGCLPRHQHPHPHHSSAPRFSPCHRGRCTLFAADPAAPSGQKIHVVESPSREYPWCHRQTDFEVASRDGGRARRRNDYWPHLGGHQQPCRFDRRCFEHRRPDRDRGSPGRPRHRHTSAASPAVGTRALEPGLPAANLVPPRRAAYPRAGTGTPRVVRRGATVFGSSTRPLSFGGYLRGELTHLGHLRTGAGTYPGPCGSGADAMCRIGAPLEQVGT